MSMATLTMIGLYNYDSNLFNNLYVPAGLHKQTLINSILLRCGEFEVIYPDLEFTKNMIDVISRKWKLSFDKWAELTTVEYNPIHNYDRLEDWTESGTNTVNTSESASGNSTGSDTGQNDNLVTTYDDDTLYQNDRSNTTSSTSSNSSSSSTGQSQGSNSVTHNAHLRGNIGVTKTQEMILDEVELRKYFNVYELIADVYCEELCIMVY